MKISAVLKNIFSNYRIMLIFLGLYYVYGFTSVKHLLLPQIILELHNKIALSGSAADLAKQFPPFLFQVLAGVILWISVISGMLYLCKRVLDNQEIHLGHFVQGIESHWKPVFTAGLILTFTVGLVKELLVGFLNGMPFGESITLVYITVAVSFSISLFYTSLVIYGSILLIEKRIEVRRLLPSVLKFVFSKEVMKLYVVMLAIGILYLPVNLLKNHFFLQVSDLSQGNLGGLLHIITNQSLPLWVKCIEWLASSLVTAITVFYTGSVVYHRPESEEV